MLHLLHPALVHFSLAFLITGGLCESVGILARRASVERFGGVLVLAGTASLLPTVVAGYLAANTVRFSPEAARALVLHERFGLAVLGTFVVLLFWKAWSRGRLPEGQRPLYAVALVAGTVLVVAGAYFGGEMVYTHGVGVRSR